MNSFQMDMLYLIGATLTMLPVCLISGTALRNASGKRLRHIQVWLLPFFVGNLLGMADILLQDYCVFISRGVTQVENLLISTLPVIAGVLDIYGLARLVGIIHKTPAAENEAVAGIELDSNREGPWPPPPAG